MFTSTMLHRIIVIAAVASDLFVTPAIAQTPPQTQQPSKQEQLIVGSEFDYPPYALVDAQGRADGFSVDLIKAVAEVMDIAIEFKVGPWNEVRTDLEQGKIDILPFVGYSPERDQKFDFSAPHTLPYAAIIGRKGSPKISAVKDLNGKEVVVIKADLTHDYLIRNKVESNLILKKDLASVLQLLASGKHDYAVVPMLPALIQIKDRNLTNLESVSKPILISEKGFSFAVKEGDTELLNRLNQGLDIIKANGKFDEIYAKWFGSVDPTLKYNEEFFELIRNIGIIGAIALSSILAWSISLRNQVNRRTSALQKEITERQHIETALRLSEASEREKSQQLKQAIEELQQIQIQLVQNEKMSALGNLVAGVAHEINNPLSCIAGNVKPANDYITDLLNLIHLYQQQFPQPGTEIEDEIDAMDLEYISLDFPKVLLSIQESANRIREISHSLRIFSRSDCDRPVPFNIHDGLDSTLLILKHRLRANEKRAEIEVVKNYGDLPNIECYAGQLNQVFMNIVANAIEAIDDASAAADTNPQLAKPYKIVLQTSLTSDHQHIQIQIKDNGIGMSENVCQKVFDHLFTTKAVGKGTGLGLAIARQVVVQTHNGTLEVSSRPGDGAEFTITLPITTSAVNQQHGKVPVSVA